TDNLAGSGRNNLLRFCRSKGFGLGNNLYRASSAMITSRNCVACGSSVKGFANHSIIRHCTGSNPSGSVYNDFGCQYVSGSCSNGSNVLIRFRDGLYGNVRQTVISFVSSNWLLRLGWSNGLALQVIVPTAR